MAFCMSTGKHTTIFDATALAFQLDDGNDKEQFVSSIRQFLAQDRLKDVSSLLMMMIMSGVALTRKNYVFYAKKEQATQI